MKITCPRCSAVYKIDAAALSQEGAYLKCARCANIFFARRRSKSEVDRLRSSRVKPRVAAPVAAPQAFEPPEPPPAPETSQGDISALEDFVLAPSETPDVAIDTGLGAVTLEEEAPPPPSVQDDIDAILRANAPRPEPEEAAAAPQTSLSNDDIEALLAANAPKEEEETPLEIATEVEPAPPSAQDDIDAILRANAPRPEPEAAAPQTSLSNDDIEALLAANAPKEEEETPLEIAVEETPALSSAQDDIDAILRANMPHHEPEAAAPQAAVSNDDIEALLAANAPKEEEAVLEAAEEPALLSGQDDIDALLAAHAPKDESAAAAVKAPSPQDDIDALLAAHAPKPEKEEEGLDDIDALLAGAAGGEAPPAPHVEEEEEPLPEPAPGGGFARPQEETDIISQDDIDALLKSSGDDVAVDESAGEEEETEIPVIEETGGDELDKLLRSQDDSVGEDLFGEGETTTAGPSAAPSLDDMLATETVEVEPGASGEETIDTDAVLGIPSAPAGRRREPAPDQTMYEPIEELEEPAARPGVMDKIMALFGVAMGVVTGSLAKLRLPGLSPRFGKAVVAIAAVAALAGGGYWFFFGHKKAGAPAEETAPAQGEGKPAAGEAAAPLGESLLASTGVASQQEPAMSFTIYLPVEFDAEISRVMKLDMTMIFENFEIRDDAMQRSFYLTVQVENTVDAFFEDKFYADTVFAQDKLEEFLNEKLKAMAPMAGLRQARVDGISFEEEAAPKPEAAPAAQAAPEGKSAAP